MAAFMPRPDIHGTLLGLFSLGASAPVDAPEETEPAPAPKPEYDERFAFEPADSCTCFVSGPCQFCLNLPDEDGAS